MCCSGGGIRSAAFNLGALQVLQRIKILQDAKYLSAVSGGSYIAAAFCMVAKTWKVEDSNARGERLGPRARDRRRAAVPSRLARGAVPAQHQTSATLAPTDMARIQLVLRMLAGLMVNVLFVGLPLFIAGLLVGLGAREAYGGMEINRTTCPRGPATCEFDAAVPTAVWAGIAAVGGPAAGLAVIGVMWRTRRDIWRVALETWQERLLLLAGAGVSLLVALPWLAEQALDRGDLQRPSSATRACPPPPCLPCRRWPRCSPPRSDTCAEWSATTGRRRPA